MKNNRIQSVAYMEELMPLIAEALNHGQSVRIYPMGISMLPMIRQNLDSVVLSPICGKLRKYDIPLYRRDNGKYVLHRIIGAGNTYICAGDNQFQPEPGIREDQMIAVVTSFYRKGREVSVSAWYYQLYCRLWHYSRPIRHFWHRGIRWLRRHCFVK